MWFCTQPSSLAISYAYYQLCKPTLFHIPTLKHKNLEFSYLIIPIANTKVESAFTSPSMFPLNLDAMFLLANRQHKSALILQIDQMVLIKYFYTVYFHNVN